MKEKRKEIKVNVDIMRSRKEEERQKRLQRFTSRMDEAAWKGKRRSDKKNIWNLGEFLRFVNFASKYIQTMYIDRLFADSLQKSLHSF